MEHAKKALLGRTGLTTITLITLSWVTIAIINLTSLPAHSESPEPLPPQAPKAEVQTVSEETVRTWNKFSGRITALETVAIRPRVGGAIDQILFAEGSRVEKGDALFVIDPRPYENELAAAKAELESAQSRVVLNTQELDRLSGLLAKRAVSQSRYDISENNLRVARAAVAAANARIRQSQLNLEYAYIKAPTAGRISRAEITAGNLVQAGPGAPLLTTIVADDEVYAEFEVDEQSYLNITRRGNQQALPVQIELADRVVRGRIHAFDNRLDARSGTIRARAVFDNAAGLLTPGRFVEVAVGSNAAAPMKLVIDAAVGTNQDKKYVYVVNSEQQIEYREVSLGRFIDGRREVLSGLEPGEMVLINGLQRVRPGMTVQPVESKITPLG